MKNLVPHPIFPWLADTQKGHKTLLDDVSGLGACFVVHGWTTHPPMTNTKAQGLFLSVSISKFSSGSWQSQTMSAGVRWHTLWCCTFAAATQFAKGLQPFLAHHCHTQCCWQLHHLQAPWLLHHLCCPSQHCQLPCCLLGAPGSAPTLGEATFFAGADASNGDSCKCCSKNDVLGCWPRHTLTLQSHITLAWTCSIAVGAIMD